MKRFISLNSLVSLLLLSIPVFGTDFYVDPVAGSTTNNGSSSAPWRTLQEVFENNLIETRTIATTPYVEGVGYSIRNSGAPVKAGDTIYLRNGYHGTVFYRGAYNTAMITITAQSGHTPTLSRMQLSAAENWIIKGITFTPEAAPNYSNPGTMLFIESHGWHGPSRSIVMENNTLYSIADNSVWSANDWDTLAASAINCHGSNCVIKNNTITNVNFGIIASGDNTLVDSNSIINFCGDGIRGAANDLTLQYNTIKNCYDVNDNHDDGIQFYNGSEDCSNAIMRGNVIINFEDSNQPLRGSLQGIGCFDGPYINFVIENNLVVVDHWHGISLYDAEQSRIINNTVYEREVGAPGPPWIYVSGQDNTILNNLSSAYTLSGSYNASHNSTVSDPALYFQDYVNLDYTLCAGSPAIDSGTSAFAPNIDISKNIRPSGSHWDIGAYEYNSVALTRLTAFTDVSLYPNPSDQSCFIKFPLGPERTVFIQFFNMAGERIHRTKQNVDEARFLIQLDTSTWAPGVYIFRITEGGDMRSGKMMVVH